MRTFHLDLAGLDTAVALPEEEIARVHLPILERLSTRTGDGRLVLFIAGAAGSGKTTLAALWERLSRDGDGLAPLQPLPMDGFHLSNEQLDRRMFEIDGETVPLRAVKGFPESFDLAALAAALRRLARGESFGWPRYDRRIHDPVPGAIEVARRGIVAVEGNFLLLDEPGWRDLSGLAGATVFVEGDPGATREGLLARRRRGGISEAEATEHLERIDLPNIARIERNRLPAEILLRYDGERRLTVEG